MSIEIPKSSFSVKEQNNLIPILVDISSNVKEINFKIDLIEKRMNKIDEKINLLSDRMDTAINILNDIKFITEEEEKILNDLNI